MFSEWMITLLALAICVLLYWYKSANRDTLWIRSSDISSLHLSGPGPKHIDQLTGEKDQPKKITPARQPWEYFLVLDVEATCVAGTDFNWPNEIIEWPVVLLTWDDRDQETRASQLRVVDEFTSYVRPTWKPRLSEFCASLTGITQTQVDAAPIFPAVLDEFRTFLCRHGLLCRKTGRRLRRFTWATDGPCDIRDFVVKQCFISKLKMPEWLRGDVFDVRRAVAAWLAQARPAQRAKPPSTWSSRKSLNISRQLAALSLAPFQGRQHSGIDVESLFKQLSINSLTVDDIQDTRNIARIIMELARRGVQLEPNLRINPERRWYWMGTRLGEIYDEYFP